MQITITSLNKSHAGGNKINIGIVAQFQIGNIPIGTIVLVGNNRFVFICGAKPQRGNVPVDTIKQGGCDQRVVIRFIINAQISKPAICSGITVLLVAPTVGSPQSLKICFTIQCKF